MGTIKEELFAKIRAHKQGWAFSAIDFITDFKRGNIDVALKELKESGDIRRVMRGIYDYPMYSSLLDKRVAPDIHQVALAIARKFNWTIYPDGNTALNYLGLSTQISTKNIYLSDGPSRRYEVETFTLEFKHIAKKEHVTSQNAMLVIQSIRAITAQQLTHHFLQALASKFALPEWKTILEEAKSSSSWIYEEIKKIVQMKQENA